MKPAPIVERAQREIICNIGQINMVERYQLNRAAARGIIEKWRGRWHPFPGASIGLGPLKSCWGPLGSQESLP